MTQSQTHSLRADDRFTFRALCATPAAEWSGHGRALLGLGLPLVGSSLAQMGLHVADTVMMGWYGVTELAAIVLASGLFFALFLLGSGFSYALMGRVAASLGAGDDTQVRRDARMALWLSIGFGLAMVPVLGSTQAILLALGQKPDIAALAGEFMQVAKWGMAPALIVATLKAYLSAFERTRVVMMITLGGVGLNVVMNWGLIFGRWGLPELGIMGAAASSVTVQCATALALLVYAVRLPELRRFHLLQRFWRPDPSALWAVAKMGLPIGLTGLAETGMFQASSVMMGWLGTVPLAAHGVALELASIAFMVHMGLSNAATVRAGRAYGQQQPLVMARGAAMAQAMSLLFGVATVSLFVLWPEALILLFLDASKPEALEILAYGTGLLLVAGLFQLFDATQVMVMGLLRGVLDTRVPMFVAIASYWLIGVPSGYVLAFGLGWGGTGLWLGLLAGLMATSITLSLRFWRGPWLKGQTKPGQTKPGEAPAR